MEEMIGSKTKAADMEEAAIRKELLLLQLEKAKLENEELQQQIDEKKLVKINRGSTARINGMGLAAEAQSLAEQQARCNHMKGGRGMDGIRGEGDDAADYAVRKHRGVNGDVTITCLRCNQEWVKINRPQSDDSSSVTYVPKEFLEEALVEWKRVSDEYMSALRFKTKNQPSGSGAFKWSKPEAELKTRPSLQMHGGKLVLVANY